MRKVILRINLFVLLIGLPCSFFGQADSLSETSSEVEIRYFDEEKIQDYKTLKEFQYDEDARYNDGIWKRIKRWLISVFERNLGQDAPVLWRMMIYIIAFGVLIFLVYYFSEVKTGAVFSKADRTMPISKNIFDEKVNVEDLKDLYTKAEENEQFRLAVRFRYLELLNQLDQLNLITLKKSKSNAQYRSEVIKSVGHSNNEAINSFDDIADIFEYAWYGDHPLEIDTYDRYKQTTQSLLHMINKKKNG